MRTHQQATLVLILAELGNLCSDELSILTVPVAYLSPEFLEPPPAYPKHIRPYRLRMRQGKSGKTAEQANDNLDINPNFPQALTLPLVRIFSSSSITC